MPRPPLYTATSVPSSVLHIPSIPGYGITQSGKPPRAILPQINAIGRELNSTGGRATRDLGGLPIPFSGPTSYQSSPFYASSNVPFTYLSPYGSAGGASTPGLHTSSATFISQTSSDVSPSPASCLLGVPYPSLLDSPRPVQEQSHLPPSTVGRKVPRKSTFVPAQSVQNSPRVAKRKTKSDVQSLRRSGMKQESTSPSSSSGRKTLKHGTSPNTRSIPTMTFPAGSKKAMASGSPHRAIVKQQVVSDEDNKIGPLISSMVVGDEPKIEPAASLITKRGRPCVKKQNVRPQPRYEYDVPPELEGVKRALGLDNWTEYVTLAEKYVLKEIAETEFNAVSQRMFSVDAKLRERIHGMIANSIITPVVEYPVKKEVKE
ncbi:hypothetical protein M3J09_013614 [Ascochyta lentis]